LLLGRRPETSLALFVREVGELLQLRPADAAVAQREAEVVLSVLLAADAGVVAVDVRGRLRLRTVGKLVLEVLLFEDTTEDLRAPIGHEELQPRLVPRAAVAVVAEDGR